MIRQELNVTIYNLQGTLVSSSSTDINNLTSGIYFIKKLIPQMACQHKFIKTKL